MSGSAEADARTPSQRGNRFRWTCGCLLAAAALTLAGVLFLSWKFEKSGRPDFDPAGYAEVIRDLAGRSPQSYGFFPREIDRDAAQVAYHHMHFFMGVGPLVCLRVRLPPERVAEILRSLEQTGREVPDPDLLRGVLGREVYPEFGLLEASYDKGRENPRSLPAEFRVFNFGSSLERFQENHADLAFVAVSSERNEVVWYAERW